MLKNYYLVEPIFSDSDYSLRTYILVNEFGHTLQRLAFQSDGTIHFVNGITDCNNWFDEQESIKEIDVESDEEITYIPIPKEEFEEVLLDYEHRLTQKIQELFELLERHRREMVYADYLDIQAYFEDENWADGIGLLCYALEWHWINLSSLDKDILTYFCRTFYRTGALQKLFNKKKEQN